MASFFMYSNEKNTVTIKFICVYCDSFISIKMMSSTTSIMTCSIFIHCNVLIPLRCTPAHIRCNAHSFFMTQVNSTDKKIDAPFSNWK